MEHKRQHKAFEYENEYAGPYNEKNVELTAARLLNDGMKFIICSLFNSFVQCCLLKKI
jgi:hypothetical protein